MRLDKKDLDPMFIDDLTGIYNKRYLNHYILNNKTEAVLCIFDIDDFKTVNDMYGHYAGDITIKEVGSILKHVLKDNIIPIRFGGDEFILIFSDNDMNAAINIIKQLMHILRDNIIRSKSCTFNITCSFGIATGNIEDYAELLNCADKALYESKDRGKNTYTVYSENLREKQIIPNFNERRLKNLLNRGWNIIISGGISTGKHACINDIGERYPQYSVYDEHNDLDTVKEPFIIVNNPLYIRINESVRYIFRIKKKYKTNELKFNNLNKIQIKTVLQKNSICSSLLCVNYTDLISSGNLGIMSRILKNGVFNTSLYDAQYDEGLFANLSDEIKKRVDNILELGLRFNLADAKNAGYEKDVRVLTDLMVLEYHNREYRYIYPALFFMLYDKSNISRGYAHIFSLAEIVNKKPSIEHAEKLYDYGDLILAEKILKKCRKNDDCYELSARVHTELSDYDNAIKDTNSIENITKRTRMDFYIMLKQGHNKGYLDYKDSESIILNMNAAMLNNDFDKFKRYADLISFRKLSDKERISYLFVLSNNERKQNNISRALKFLKKAEFIALRQHYLADYAKILMNIGILLDDINEIKNALKYMRNALQIFELTNLIDFAESTMLNMAVVYIRSGDYSKGIQYLSELMTGKKSLQNAYFRGIILHNLSELYLRCWNLQQAELFNKKCKELFNSMDIQVPQYIIESEIKIKAAKGNISTIEYDKNSDIIDEIDRKIILCRNNDCKEIFNHIIDSDMCNDEKSDYLTYMALLKRKEKSEMMFLLKEAHKLCLDEGFIMKKKHIETLMEDR